MSVSTPLCNFGEKSHDFSLKSTEGKLITRMKYLKNLGRKLQL